MCRPQSAYCHFIIRRTRKILSYSFHCSSHSHATAIVSLASLVNSAVKILQQFQVRGDDEEASKEPNALQKETERLETISCAFGFPYDNWTMVNAARFHRGSSDRKRKAKNMTECHLLHSHWKWPGRYSATDTQAD